jgi:hypothetical protein
MEDLSNNYFFKYKRIIRGIDESHIESMGEAADPVVVKSTSASFI